MESAALKGDDKSQIEVTGDGMDPVLLTSLLRKKIGYAELVSVGPAGEKKDENKPKNPEVKPQPPQYWPPYYGGLVPHYDYPVVFADRSADPCSIMWEDKQRHDTEDLRNYNLNCTWGSYSVTLGLEMIDEQKERKGIEILTKQVD